ncbi:MAG: molybdopterin-guanine dinucleotide biosynthesis protein B [Candidatus Bipolaricaulota bacterium]|nr:molybdopterin-guanine dinucleotide biosynthesis protein B [Candidatus Bipolaricaulota bacterium]MCS7274422.1 molybdopterin-guanine dinucleotide biosynthesis protein B [Candidatus Bipolaricaulota bacterium]MDW8110851.1 molybdopterin-guanine dinucleotide biosynthesis protein B [Candidatus Bipolaricaulota bacterium]MDW8328668.1 molybdopterin-guanine dinucleotide biosynthesis protein B [Candidatus Bipolaricaulota bacterium]
MKSLNDLKPPAVAVVGESGVGKTTLILELIRTLSARGYRVGAIKHTHHTEIEFDTPGKDSYKMKAAGAVTVALATPQRLMLVRDGPPKLEELLQRDFSELDVVLVEGFKESDLPKILVERDGSRETQHANLIARLRSPFGAAEVAQIADLLERRVLS